MSDPKFPGLRRKKRERARLAAVYRIRCHLCQGVFRASSRFVRFDQLCRAEDEVFRFSEWLDRGNRK